MEHPIKTLYFCIALQYYAKICYDSGLGLWKKLQDCHAVFGDCEFMSILKYFAIQQFFNWVAQNLQKFFLQSFNLHLSLHAISKPVMLIALKFLFFWTIQIGKKDRHYCYVPTYLPTYLPAKTFLDLKFFSWLNFSEELISAFLPFKSKILKEK